MQNHMKPRNRRTFLRRSLQVGLALCAPATLQARSASDRVVTALIGCGGRGRRFYDHADYVCDPDHNRRRQAAKLAKVASHRALDDLRRVLDRDDVDAVVIATPDHWHAPAAILACQAGKHVYVEKPWSHNFRESEWLYQAAVRNEVVVQHGTQQRSNPATRDAMAMLHDGIIGDVLIAKAWNIQRRKNIGHQQPSTPPPSVDYDLWVGPAEFLPYQANRFHYDWHWWYNFGTGDIGNDGTHEIDYARWGLGVDELPTRVTALGGKYYHDDDQQFPDTASCVFEYGSGRPVGEKKQLLFEMRIWSTNYPYNCDSGVEFLGTEGKMVFSKRGRLQILGDRNKVIESKKKTPSYTPNHVDDFFDAIRNGRQPNANRDEAHRSVSLVHLANIAVRTGRTITIDPAGEIELAEQDRPLLGRTYRADNHWAIPSFARS